jgi:hypothetical protein
LAPVKGRRNRDSQQATDRCGDMTCGRIGAAAGSITTGKSRFFDFKRRNMALRRESSLPFGDQEAVGCD